VSHRGSSGTFPEHTEGAYTDCYFQGADFVELDVQLTKDGVLVINHDPTLKDTINIGDYEFLF